METYLLLFLTTLMMIIWGISVANREVFTWRKSKKTEGPVWFLGKDYHGNRIFENIGVVGTMFLLPLLYMSNIGTYYFIPALYSTSWMIYCFVYNKQYYGKWFTDRSKIDNDYVFFGKTIKNVNAWVLVGITFGLWLLGYFSFRTF